MNFIINALAGALCGVLSGFGLGGGSLLLVYMTHIAGMAQAAAQGVNLIYFLPTSAAALISHVKNGLIEKKAVLWAAAPGMIASLAAAWVATAVDPGLLRRLFGIFLLVIGVRMLLKK